MKTAFGAFTFDDATHELRCGDRFVHLSPKAFDLLRALLRMRPSAISKEDLHRELWPDTFVSDGSLAVLVSEIRHALGDSAHHPVFVRTVSRFGYAFVAAAAAPPTRPSSDARAAFTCTLAWGGEHVRLKSGENVVGRDPEADICIDAVGVSRRHAVIVVADDSVTLHDLSSKNGTFANGDRVLSPVQLLHNAEIRLGALSLRFRRSSVTAPTQTLEGSPHSGASS